MEQLGLVPCGAGIVVVKVVWPSTEPDRPFSRLGFSRLLLLQLRLCFWQPLWYMGRIDIEWFNRSGVLNSARDVPKPFSIYYTH